MKKTIITVLFVLLLLGILLFFFARQSIPQDLEKANVVDSIVTTEENTANKIEINPESLPTVEEFYFNYTGYGPAGKSHTGTFSEYTLSTSTIVFSASSVNTGIEKLDIHLCTPDFFDCQKFPNISFEANKIVQTDENSFEATGLLTFKDQTKQVTFPVKAEGNYFTADFILDTTSFGFDPDLVSNEVRINFSFKVNP